MGDKKPRYIFVRDNEQSKLNFPSAETAHAYCSAEGLIAGAAGDTDMRRIRLRRRERTGLYDVVVKVRREVTESAPKKEAATDAGA